MIFTKVIFLIQANIIRPIINSPCEFLLAKT